MKPSEAKTLQKYVCYELKFIRRQQKLSQEEVAFQLDVTASYLSRIENGQFTNTPMYFFFQLCDIYNVKFANVINNAIEKKRLDAQYYS
ncbi:helix-turn-helix transcriptional regulator [Staphylococcus sp. Marseille-Q6910]|uniref:helix-turn-helix domain-containing protein n=1 Tax=Staphylococcus sp. Marseille-Q6910 TaxID=2937990 RepID=UPI00204093FE|nr:helix-turn-helix transcriptional regulator [Staphylococcus sp. Marseille-Q6910]